ncbi:MAG: pyridoxal 5'-phosphate synthase glutaminase subunit PdxT [Anaerolineae bacterium]|nr:pyridoxal 5'-phosphate synthase glutaminase subunit PdxT [Anaerolineae bacterium]
MKIGVLALQGNFAEHLVSLERIGVQSCEVRLPEQLDSIDGLIIPGGESTTIGKLATDFNLIEPLQRFGRQKAIWGTCAGAIFLSNDTIGRKQPILGLMDIQIERNAFGRQIASFETELPVAAFSAAGLDAADYHAIFIRAPLIAAVGPQVKVISRLSDGRIVAAQQGRLLATSFHPELTTDDRFHRYFISLI